MDWLVRLFRPRPVIPAARPALMPDAAATATTAAPGPLAAAAGTGQRPAIPSADADPVVAAGGDSDDDGPPPLIAWLLGLPAVEQPPSAAEQQAIAAIDDVLERPGLPAELLPRAAALVPRLIAMLRQGDLPVPVLAERIGRDPAITAEVLRLSRNAFYGGGDTVTDLPRAISVLGVDGVQTAITRVVLRPLYQVQAGSLTARAGTRQWAHAEALSRRTAQAAQAAGLPPFDGYLAGLLHGTGWTVLCRALDLARLSLEGPIGTAAAEALDAHAHRLFGRAAQPWDITPAFAALTADARRHALADSTLPLAMALRGAHVGAVADALAAVDSAAASGAG